MTAIGPVTPVVRFADTPPSATSVTSASATSSAAASGAGAARAPVKTATADPKLVQAAKDFEAIFVRQMLKGLEKTTAAGCGTSASAGEKTYGSMIVDTLSDSISKAGGLGLADVIAQSMAMSHPSLKAVAPAEKPAVASARPLIPELKPRK